MAEEKRKHLGFVSRVRPTNTPSGDKNTEEESLGVLTTLNGLIAALIGGPNAGNKIMSGKDKSGAAKSIISGIGSDGGFIGLLHGISEISKAIKDNKETINKQTNDFPKINNTSTLSNDVYINGVKNQLIENKANIMVAISTITGAIENSTSFICNTIEDSIKDINKNPLKLEINGDISNISKLINKINDNNELPITVTFNGNNDNIIQILESLSQNKPTITVTFTGDTSNIKTFIDEINANKELPITVTFNGNDDSVNSILSVLSKENPTINVTFNGNDDNVKNILSVLLQENPTIDVKFTGDINNINELINRINTNNELPIIVTFNGNDDSVNSILSVLSQENPTIDVKFTGDINNVKTLIDEINANKELPITVTFNGNDDSVKNILSVLSKENPTIDVKFTGNINNINELINKINTNNELPITVTFNGNDDSVNSILSILSKENPTINVTFNGNDDSVNSILSVLSQENPTIDVKFTGDINNVKTLIDEINANKELPITVTFNGNDDSVKNILSVLSKENPTIDVKFTGNINNINELINKINTNNELPITVTFNGNDDSVKNILSVLSQENPTIDVKFTGDINNVKTLIDEINANKELPITIKFNIENGEDVQAKVANIFKGINNILNLINNEIKGNNGKKGKKSEQSNILYLDVYTATLNKISENIRNFVTSIQSINNKIDMQTIDNINSYISAIESIQKKLNDIKTDIDTKAQERFNTIFTNVNNVINTINQNKGIFETKFPDISTFKESLNVFINDVNNKDEITKFNDENIFTSLETVFSSISNISLPNEKEIGKLTDLFKAILKIFNDITLDDNIIKIKYLTDTAVNVIGLIKTISEINNEEKTLDLVKRNLRKIKDIVTNDKDKDSLLALCKSMNAFNKIEIKTNDVKDKLDLINTLFETLTEATNINIIKTKFNVWFIKHFLIDDVTEIIKLLNEKASEITKNEIDFKIFSNFMTALSNVVSWDSKQRRNAYRNIQYIHDYIVKSVAEIISALNDASKDANENGAKLISNLSEFFESIGKIADISLFKIVVTIPVKTSLINLIVNDAISSILDNLNDLSEKVNNVIPILDVFEDLFNFYTELNDNIPGVVKTTKMWLKLGILNSLINDELNNLIINIKKIELGRAVNAKIESLLKLLPKIDTLITNINNLNIVNIVKLKSLLKSIDELEKISKRLRVIGNLKFPTAGFAVLDKEADTIKGIIDKLGKIDEKQLKKSIDVLKSFTLILTASSLVLVTASMVSALINPMGLITFTGCLFGLIAGVMGIFGLKWFKDSLKESLDGAKGMSLLILTAGGVLLLGSFIMNFIDKSNLAEFTIALGTFLIGIILAIRSVGKNIENALDSVKSISDLVMKSAAILILGAFIYKYLPLDGLFGFTVTLGVFVFGLLFIFAQASKSINKDLFNTINSLTKLVAISGALLIAGSLIFKFVKWYDVVLFVAAECVFIIGLLRIWMYAGEKLKELNNDGKFIPNEFLKLIVVSSSILMLGSLISSIVGWEDVVAFGVMLSVLIVTVGGVYYVLAKKSQDIKNAAKDFALIVGISGAILMAGAIVMKLASPANVIGFAVILGLFIWGITHIYTEYGKDIRNNINYAMQLGVLILLSSIALLPAIYIMKDGWAPLQIIGYGFILAGFIWGITFIYKKLGREIIQSIPSAVALGIIVMLSSLALSIGILFMDKYPNGAEHIVGFTFATFVLVGGFALIVWRLSKIDKIKLIQGILALLAISVISLLCATVIGKIAKIGQDYDLKKTWMVLLQMGTIILGVTALAIGLGALTLSGFGTAALIAGIAALGAIVAIVYYAGKAMKMIADSMVAMEKVKGFNPKPIINGIKGFMEIAFSLKSIIGISPIISIASYTIISLSNALSKIAKSVKDYASLRVPIYEGTKIVGYRSLKTEDFKNASTNVSIVITTLGNAVLNTYNKNPKLFKGFKFAMIVTSISTLGNLLSKIARSVKNYASLVVPEYNGTKIVKYNKLDKTDFENAAKNIGIVITTLSKAVVSVYDNNPEMFETNWYGRSKFAKVTMALSKLGSLISRISSGIKDYANFTAPIYDEKTGQLIGKESIGESHFTKASTCISTIISVLGNAIIDAYKAHPDYYETTGGIFGFGGSSPFTRTISANMKLASLISTIARAVKDYANFTVPKYNEKGELVGKERLSESHFKEASACITSIITMLGGAIIKAYELHPDYYETTGGIFGFGGSSPFTRTISANMKLASLISTIARAVKDYANFTVPIYDEKTGQLKGNRTLDSSDFIKASNNIKLILSTLGASIIATYNSNKDMYDEKGLIGGNSPFTNTINANTKLANLISKIASGIKDFSNLTMPIYDEKTGQLKGNRTLSNKDFINASKNISTVISILGNTIISVSKEHKDWFEDGKDSVFAQTCDSLSNMGNMISNIANGVKLYSELKFPVYDPNTKAIKENEYKMLDKKDFENAADNIALIISTLGKSIIQVFNENTDWFEDGNDSLFKKVSESVLGMGQMIGSIASGLKEYSMLNIPLRWNPDGTIAEYTKMKDPDFTAAADNIKKIIRVIGGAILDLSNDPRAAEMFDIPGPKSLKGLIFGEDSDNKFIRIVQSCMAMGNMISVIAESVKDFASMQVPEYDSNGYPTGKIVRLDKSDFTNAGTNISTIIDTIGNALMTTFEKHKDWFDGKENTNFDNIIKGAASMGRVINNIAQSIKNYANLTVPLYDETGKKISDNVTLNKFDFETAANNIGKIITTLGNSIAGIDSDLLKNDNLPNIIDSIISISKVIGIISKGISDYSKLAMPISFDDKGNPTAYRQLTEQDFTNAGNNIGNVLMIIGNKILEISEHPAFTKFAPVAKNISLLYKNIGSSLASIVGTIKLFASEKYIDENGNVISINSTVIDGAIDRIQKIITAIGRGIVDAIGDNADLFGKQGFWDWAVGKKSSESNIPALVAAKAISMMVSPIAEIAKILSIYANGNIVDENGKTINLDIDAARKNIVKLLSSLISVISGQASIGKEKIDLSNFELDKNGKSLANSVIEGITNIVGIINNIAEEIKVFNEIDQENNISNNIDTIIQNIKNIIYGSDTKGGILSLSSIFDKNDNFTKFNNLNVNEINKMNTIFSSIVSASENSIENLKQLNDEIIDFVPTIKIEQHVLNIFERINNILNGFIDNIYNNFNKTNIDVDAINSTYQTINTMFKSIISINNLYEENNEKINGAKSNIDKIKKFVLNCVNIYSIIHNVLSANNFNKKVIELNNVKTDINIFNALINFINRVNQIVSKYNAENDDNNKFSKITKLFEDYKSLNNIINNQLISADKQYVNKLDKIKEQFENNKEIIDGLVISMKTIINSFENTTDFGENGDNNIFSKITKLFTDYNNLSSIINNGLNSFTSKLFKNKFNNNLTEQFTHDEAIIKQLLISIENIKQSFIGAVDFSKNGELFKTISDFITFIYTVKKQIAEKENSEDENNLFTNYLQTINDFISLSEYAKNIGTDGYDNISEGIDDVYTSTNNIGNNKNFKEHVEALSKYVRSINSLNTSKIDKITHMANSMNALATKFGDLDTFAKNFEANLSKILDKLTEELALSKDTIDKAESIQTKRHQLISESITKIQTIMKDPLQINIVKVDDTSSLTNDGGNGNGNSQTPQGGGGNNASSKPSSNDTNSSLSSSGGTMPKASDDNATSTKGNSSSESKNKKDSQKTSSNDTVENKFKTILNRMDQLITKSSSIETSITKLKNDLSGQI